MTAKRRLFVREYLKDFNATQAAIRAGYSEHTATKQGARLLTFVDVRDAVDRGITHIIGNRDEQIARVIRELQAIAFADIRDFVTWGPRGVRVRDSDELTPEQAAAISEVVQTDTNAGRTVRVKLASKEKALEQLGRYLRMFQAEALISLNAPTQINIALVDSADSQSEEGSQS